MLYYFNNNKRQYLYFIKNFKLLRNFWRFAGTFWCKTKKASASCTGFWFSVEVY